MKCLKSILLIDDSQASNELNSYCLNKMEASDEIHIVKDGNEALELLLDSEEWPELIFLDIKMPVMSGFEFLREYDETCEEASNTVIVVLTTSSSPLDIKDAELSGKVAAYYNKPLDEKKIAKIFNNYFSN